MLNPKIQYNYRSNNYIPELLMTYSVVIDGEFLWSGVNIAVNHYCRTSPENSLASNQNFSIHTHAKTATSNS